MSDDIRALIQHHLPGFPMRHGGRLVTDTTETSATATSTWTT